MTKEPNTAVVALRKFSRFYTNLLGLLNKHLLNSPFSLTEARILYELAETPHSTAKQLAAKLEVDPGYLSRTLKKLVQQGLLQRQPSAADRREYHLALTAKGSRTMTQLSKLSDAQGRGLLAHLSETEQQQLVASMQQVQRLLSPQQKPEVTLRDTLLPGDVGALIQLHGEIYARECGYNHIFEAYVCKTFFNFLLQYDPQKSRIFIAEAAGQVVGCVAVMEHPDGLCQLRWFLLRPTFRGVGLGGQLLKKALQFARNAGYCNIFLETTDDQQAAIAIYEKLGFQKTGSTPNDTWGVQHTEMRYEMAL